MARNGAKTFLIVIAVYYSQILWPRAKAELAFALLCMWSLLLKCQMLMPMGLEDRLIVQNYAMQTIKLMAIQKVAPDVIPGALAIHQSSLLIIMKLVEPGWKTYCDKLLLVSGACKLLMKD